MAIDYCNYHPLSPATFSCAHCHNLHCDGCADEGDGRGDPVCFNCSQVLDALGSANQATPFWRRLQESFRYPLRANALVLILAVSLLSSVVIYLPLGWLWMLMLSGAFMKYCFSSLENTARGLLVPPDITEAYNGGLALLLNLLIMFIAAGAAVVAALFFLGPQVAGLLGVFIVVALPAMVIIYAMSESMLEALNPANQLRLIAAIGLPYGLLLAFIMIMSASVGVISEVIGYELSFISNSLQSITANYYTLVTFHIMGYMIFQYQGELGFVAREDDGEVKAPRPDRDRLAAKLDIKLKDGDYNAVVGLFEAALKKFPSDRYFNRQYFEFLFATERNLEAAANRYLDFLLRSDQEHQLVIIYKRVLHLLPSFRPASAATRHRLAEACLLSGDSLSAAKLINGLHKDAPDYPELAHAYRLMAQALENLPNRADQAQKCKLLAEQLARRSAQSAAKSPRAEDPSPAQQLKRIAGYAEKNLAPEVQKEPTEDQKDLPPIEFK